MISKSLLLFIAIALFVPRTVSAGGELDVCIDICVEVFDDQSLCLTLCTAIIEDGLAIDRRYPNCHSKCVPWCKANGLSGDCVRDCQAFCNHLRSDSPSAMLAVQIPANVQPMTSVTVQGCGMSEVPQPCSAPHAIPMPKSGRGCLSRLFGRR
jgi:hypothetical protein